MAVWAILMLSLFAIGLSDLVRQRLLVYNRLSQRERLRTAAEAVAKKVMKDFGVGENNLAAEFREKKSGVFLELGTRHIEDMEITYKLTDENRRININRSDFFVLKNFFQLTARLTEESSARIAASVMDYIDPDDFISTYFDKGSEKDAYEDSGYSYAPKNAPLELIAELSFVKGMTPQIFEAVRDSVTVYGNGFLNINSADKQALLSIGLHPSLVEKIIAIRKGMVDKNGKSWDHFLFTNMQTLLSDILSFYNLSDYEKMSLVQAVGLNRLGLEADCYRLEVKAKILRKDITSTVACIFSPREGTRYWFEK